MTLRRTSPVRAALLPLAVAAGILAAPAAAQVDPATLGAEHFVGHWSLDGPEGGADRDTLSFFPSGAWAVTNGGDNPVEVIGTWRIEGGKIAIAQHSLRRPAETEPGAITVLSAEGDRMEISVDYDEGKGRQFTLDRCS